MSAPISSSFNKLSITPMSSRTDPKGKERIPTSDDDTSNSDESSEEESEDHDSGSDGENDESVYTHGVYAIDHCRFTGAHFAFQMASCKVERHSIRINAALPGGMTCSCGGSKCHHANWFASQLAGTQSNALLTPYEQISIRGFNRVCEDLQWELREENDSVPEETRWQLHKDYTSSGLRSRTMMKQRMDSVCDIMATMSSKVPDDYRRDLFSAPENFSKDLIFTKGDLEATISKFLVFDDNFFNAFQHLVPQHVRASDYFNKMGVRAKDACDRLDSFCELGQASDQGPYDLIWCARQLCKIVASISDNVAKRQPLGLSPRETAAKTLIFILSMVVNRNHDAYQNSNIAQERPRNEAPKDRNLYLRLIGDPRSSLAGNNFILGALQDLPEAVQYVEELNDILVKLDSADWAAPQIYRDKLSALISYLKTGSVSSSPSSTTPGKRTAGSLERMTNKRMK